MIIPEDANRYGHRDAVFIDNGVAVFILIHHPAFRIGRQLPQRRVKVYFLTIWGCPFHLESGNI
jgi:hypothetical protein